jgi:hypothetical protein
MIVNCCRAWEKQCASEDRSANTIGVGLEAEDVRRMKTDQEPGHSQALKF